MPEPTAAPEAPGAGAEPTGLTPEDRAALEAVVAKERSTTKSERKAREAAERQLAELAEASKTETEKLIEKARREAADTTRQEVSGAYKSRILNAEIRAQAAGRFSNPRLATRLLDLKVDDVLDDDGEPDTAAISKAIDDFLALEENAGLKVGASSTRPSGSADAGKGNGAPAGDMNAYIRGGIRKK